MSLDAFPDLCCHFLFYVQKTFSTLSLCVSFLSCDKERNHLKGKMVDLGSQFLKFQPIDWLCSLLYVKQKHHGERARGEKLVTSRQPGNRESERAKWVGLGTRHGPQSHTPVTRSLQPDPMT